MTDTNNTKETKVNTDDVTTIDKDGNPVDTKKAEDTPSFSWSTVGKIAAGLAVTAGVIYGIRAIGARNSSDAAVAAIDALGNAPVEDVLNITSVADI